MHACTELCIYEGVSVFLALMCAVFTVFVAYHDVTAACMSVPVWGHLTNTMNVDIVESFLSFFFFSPKVFSNFSARVIGDLKKDQRRDFHDCHFGSTDR